MNQPTQARTVYAEMTPNPATMKFVADGLLVPPNAIFEYAHAAEANESPLAKALFSFPFVANIFINANYITITKTEAVEWQDMVLELREFIAAYLKEGKPIVNENAQNKKVTSAPQAIHSEAQHSDFTEVEKQIIQVLDEYVRPAVEGDGGAIEFEKFENGTVYVTMRGACSGCPSSTMTLKAGIEGLLNRMVPEVREVVASNG